MSGPSDYQPSQSRLAMVRAALADYGPHAFLVRGLSDAAQPELLVDLRRHPVLHAGHADPDRRDPGDALHAERRSRLQVGRAHRARRQLRLAAPQHARGRRVDVLLRGLHPHVPRPVLRLVQGAARGAVDPRRHHLPPDDGDRLHGLCAAVGPDELLGRHRHHQPVLGDPLRRRQHRDLAVGRLLRRQSDAEPLLLAALPAAVRDRRRRGAARLGAACRRPEQSGRRRAQDRQGHGAVHALRDHQGHVRRLVLHAALSPGSSSTCRTISATPTTISRPIPA